jgi:hypothetical protein
MKIILYIPGAAYLYGGCMKARGRTGKGCYKEYFFIPAWFIKKIRDTGNGSLLNLLNDRHYIGFGFNKQTKDWHGGVFLSDLEMGLPFWRQKTREADFIIHFGGAA